MARKVVTVDQQFGMGVIVFLMSMLFAVATGLILTAFFSFPVAVGLGIFSMIVWFAVGSMLIASIYGDHEWE